MKKIRVLIVEDSPVVRQLLTHIVAQDRRLEVAAAVGSAEEALSVLGSARPDIISMDIRLPGMSGLEATLRIMSERPTPIVVVAASVECEELRIAISALEAGALTVLEKPAGVSSEGYEAMAGRLCTQLAIMSQVKVVRQRRDREQRSPEHRVRLAPPVLPGSTGYRMLGIVSSTGGPSALAQLLGGLGPDFPLPIALVQHITSSFLEGFASWLAGVSGFKVVIVRDRVTPVAGSLYLATVDRHLRAAPGGLYAIESEPVSGQRPSGTVLFESMASAFGGEALGVLLTGMGDDGAKGLLELRRAAGYTLAEDESTAVVYGMPAVAVRLGAVCESLPLPAIAPRLRQLAVSRREAA